MWETLHSLSLSLSYTLVHKENLKMWLQLQSNDIQLAWHIPGEHTLAQHFLLKKAQQKFLYNTDVWTWDILSPKYCEEWKECKRIENDECPGY